MKLIYEITTRDDKTTAYECVDLHYFNDAFLVLNKRNFQKEFIRTEAILHFKSYFKL